MNDMLIALEITTLGMGLVFAAIILLWWTMTLLTFITADRKLTSDSTEPAPVMDSDLKARAAAVAVAMALAEQQASIAHPLLDPPTAIVSAWQLGMRTRQMYQKGVPIRRSRTIGDK
jgi:Na+-transporting methylmalonyl-CoA/oxaloacetate decarboxylase gamma subunit